jgi:hypothetical protein
VADFVDLLCLAIAALLPIFLVMRWKLLGVALGTLVVWGSLAVAGSLLSALDPQREAGLLDGVWLLFGWLVGLLYCGVLYLLRYLACHLWRAFAAPRQESGP